MRRLAVLLLLGGCADGARAGAMAAVGGAASAGDGSTTSDAASSTGDAPARRPGHGDPEPPSRESATDHGSTTSPDATTGAPDEADEADGDLLPAPTWPAFEDVSDAAGVNAPHGVALGHHAIGQAWGDYDRDGWLDLYVTGGMLPSVLYRNRGDGTFEVAAEGQPLALPEARTAGPAWGDYDNDGWLDLYVTTDGPNRLFHNDGGAGFTSVGIAAGVQDERHGVMAAWGDYDRDGWLDLYVANHGGDHDVMFHNEGDGTFTEVTELVEPGHPTAAFAATFIDFDHDGDPDIHVVNDHVRGNDLYRNDGPGCRGWCFTNVRHETGTDLHIDGMGQAVGDYDRDGDLDLFFSDIYDVHLLQSQTAQGQARFEEVTAQANLACLANSWGAVFLDFDDDGWPDLYLATEEPQAPLTNRLWRNRGDGTFEDVSDLSGADEAGFTYGAVHADYDHDGFVDLVIGNRGEGYHLYRNTGTTGPGRHYVTLDLVGGGPINRDAIGTRVTVVDTLGVRHTDEVRSGSNMGGGSMLRLHFGLGAAHVDAVEIRWPNGQQRTLHGIPTDALVEIEYPG